MGITMKEIARRAGVSRPAVSAVLNNTTASRVSVEKRELILKLARETGYVPNVAAQQLKGKSNRLVGLVTVPSHMGIVATLQSELISSLQRHGFETLTIQRGEVDAALLDLRARGVRGIVVLGELSIARKRRFCPIVNCSDFSNKDSDVSCDREWGGFEAATHLIQVHGRRRLVFVTMDPLEGPNASKYAGILRAAQEAGLPMDSSNLLIANTTPRRLESGLYEVASADAREVIAEIARRKADAVICANDFIAGRLMPWFEDAGLRVPSDLSVVGYDGYTWTRFAAVPLATIVQPVRAIAEVTAETLVERIDKAAVDAAPAGLKIKPRFLPAESCGCACERVTGVDGLAETIIPIDRAASETS